MLKISVIVPVFNTEKYVHECLDSLINQTYKNIEIVVIDDGSTDESGNICEKYAKKDERVILKHIRNQGVNHARKIGLGLASGDYIAYVDSDDWLDLDTFQKLISHMEDNLPDIVAFGHTKEYPKAADKRPENIEDGFYTIKEMEERIDQLLVDEEYFYIQTISAMIGGKLVKRSLIIKNQGFINDRFRIGEDVALFNRYYSQSKEIMVINLCSDHYRVRDNSAIQTVNSADYTGFLEFVKCLVDGIGDRKSTKIPSKILCDIFYQIMFCFPEKVLNKSVAELNMFKGVKKGSKVIIYGKGIFSKGLAKYISETGFVKLLGIVDSLDKDQIFQLGDYDYILIAITNGKLVQRIYKELLKMGVLKEKIVYIRNCDLEIEKLPDEVIEIIKNRNVLSNQK